MKLFTLQARYGDSLILQYGPNSKPRFMLIDGGPTKVFDNYLRPELEYITNNGGTLDAVVLSHADRDHVTGLLHLFAELRINDTDKVAPLIGINDLWINSFDKSIATGNDIASSLSRVFSNTPHGKSVLKNTDVALNSIEEGNRLKRMAKALQIPINSKFKGKLITVEKFRKPFKLNNITLQIIGPTQENLDELKQEWLEWFGNNEDKLSDSDPSVASYSDKSIPNLSSLMFLVTDKKGKTILFTGDGRGDHVIDGLTMQGLLDENDNFYVDVLKVAHHGSDNNVTAEFFEQVQAGTYVISGDGTHGNPELNVMEWILQAAKKQGRHITLYVTNATSPVNELLENYDQNEYNYELYYLPDDATSMEVEF